MGTLYLTHLIGFTTPSHFPLQPFRERLSEKVHASIPKGIVGGFKFTVLQRNLKEWQERSLSMFASAKGKKQK